MHTTNPSGSHRVTAVSRPERMARPMVLAALLLALLLAPVTAGSAAPVLTRDDAPITGDMHAGPLGLNPPAVRNQGVLPTAIRIANAQVDAEVETVEIVDGVMQNPTGPWVVSWYEETAELGVRGNVVMAGHIDYWNVGPAVFFNLRDMAPGDQIEVIGEDQSSHFYTVEWNETYDLEELTSGRISELVGPTEDPVISLITCGGEFDYASGEYLSRTVVRGALVEA